MSPDKQLEDLLLVLVARFGAGCSLGEVYATSYFFRTLREGRKTSVSDAARATGLSKQNLSRWLQSKIDLGEVYTHLSDDDARIQEIGIVDLEWSYRHLELLAEILGCDVDSPRRSTKAPSLL
jgi:transcriptional regulator with XRE-family HTH domain